MSKKIPSIESVYREATDNPRGNMTISAGLVIEMVERIGDLENAVIDFQAGLRTCQNASNSIMEQYKDL
jgi:hypothetical protein